MLFLGGTLQAQGDFRLIPNRGQWEEKILFKADLKACRLFVTRGELTYLFYHSEQIHNAQHDNDFSGKVDAHAIRIRFLNASSSAIYSGMGTSSEYYNFFKGKDSSRWRTGIHANNKLYVSGIYKGIDFELFENNGTLKYNFIVAPGADPSQIQIEYQGADYLKIDNGLLKAGTRFGEITELKPLVYQEKNEIRTTLSSSYTLEGNVLGFSISSKRNAGAATIIDPVLVFSTYSGSRADNFGYTATYDTLGNGYAGGTVFDFGFPTTTGAFQMNFAGGASENMSIGYIERDCGILKFSPNGSSLIYATYLGGALQNDQPHSMVVDSKLNLFVMGTTKSNDFPSSSGSSYNKTLKGLSDIFIVRFTPDGTQLKAGALIGGSGFDGLNGDRATQNVSPLLYNYADDFRGEIIVDRNDDVYVASVTMSQDFPTINAFDMTYSGLQDGVVFKMNADLTNLIFSSFIGGSGDDAAYGIDLGTRGDLYVTGGTTSPTFGYNVQGMSKNFNGGRADGFLMRLILANSSLDAYTFIGSDAYDQSYFVKTDKYGKPFVFGQTEGLHAMSQGVEGTANSRQFIKKFNVNLTAIEIQTTFGANNKAMPDISPTALLVDECERVFIAGWGGINFSGFPGSGTGAMKITDDAYQKTTDGYDFYLAVFSKNLSELQYATYFGGRSKPPFDNAHEHVDGGTSRFDKKGVVYQSVCAGCGSRSKNIFPATSGVWSNTNKSDNCNNALFKFDFENLNRKPQASNAIYELFATDTLDFTLEVSDPDIADSLRLLLDGPVFHDPKYPKPLPYIKSLTKVNGKNAIRANIFYNPSCYQSSTDTIKIYLKVYDQGCPTQDSNQAVIKILVKAPPLSVTPETYCLNFNPDGSVNIQWDEFLKNKYFKYALLKRTDPNGRTVTLDTLRQTGAFKYRDKPPGDPQSNNYVYYMQAYNICNAVFDNGAKVSTTKEFNVPIDSTYMTYATVVDNQSVQVNWFRSTEEDFESYDIYRALNINGQSEGFRKVKTIYNVSDTFFRDDNVQVASKSYCYKVRVNDKCGHFSLPSNEACNIVLKGEAGHLYFDLDWLPYRDWLGGVKNYNLSRRVDTGILRRLINTNLLRVHHDEDLDLWWGAYYYVVDAYEGTNQNGGGYNASSRSNEIRLIQPPMVFVPNAFSPNNDGHNDVWGVSHAFVKEFRMQVYNRWGEKVWDNDFKGNQWDGTYRGALAMNDVFVWIVTYKGWDGKFYTQKGTVTVMP